jgi:hypothetical protein
MGRIVRGNSNGQKCELKDENRYQYGKVENNTCKHCSTGSRCAEKTGGGGAGGKGNIFFTKQ